MNIVRLFRFAQGAVARIPEPVGRALFDAVGTVAGSLPRAKNRQLRKNYSRIHPGLSRRASRSLSAAGMRSYMRYYYESFLLPSLTREQILARVRIVHAEELRGEFAQGRAVTGALTHSGNWDLAGAWAELALAPVHTLAEKLEPQELYDFFVGYRTAVGMTIYPTGHGALRSLEADMRSTACFTPILADRDLTASGVEVEFFGEKMLVAAGPALLAQRTGCPIFPVFSYFERLEGEKRKLAGTSRGMVLVVGEPVHARTTHSSSPEERAADIARMSQEWITQFEPWIREHSEDWHMLQKVFVADLDPERLARTRERARAAVEQFTRSDDESVQGDAVESAQGDAVESTRGDVVESAQGDDVEQSTPDSSDQATARGGANPQPTESAGEEDR